MSKPAIIAIFSHKQHLSTNEKVSLRQCWRVLGSHPVHLICPIGLDTSEYTSIAPGLVVKQIRQKHFDSLRAYNRLKILPQLYEIYSQYNYFLTYELDAFVFRDELLSWCERGYDYIGAPWFEGYHSANYNSSLIAGGNSGFSLRKISSVLQVTQTFKSIEPWVHLLEEQRATEDNLIKKGLLLGRSLAGNNFHRYLNHFAKNEDLFWSVHVPKRFNWFRIAPYELAMKFSFDMNPQRLYDDNDHKLPFGCHKWYGQTFGFWRPHVEAEGYYLTKADSDGV